VVSVYSLTWMAGRADAPVVGPAVRPLRTAPRLFRSGLLLLGGSFLVASRAQALWQFQLSSRIVCRDRHLADRRCAEFYSARPLVRPTIADRDGDPSTPATGAGILVLLPVLAGG